MHELVEQIFQEAKSIFFMEECDNILSDIAERNLCGRLSIYLTCRLKEHGIHGYFADTEYNRKQGGQVKTVLDEERNIVTIQSDLIVHSRGNIIDEDNILAIEMKKSTRPEAEKIADRKRLRAMTKASYDGVWSADGQTHPEHVCGYILGVYIILNIAARTYTLEFYRHGEQINSLKEKEMTASVNLQKIIGERNNLNDYHFFVVNGSQRQSVTLNPDGTNSSEGQ